MKKLLAILLASMVLLGCVGCGQKPEPDPSQDADVSTGTSVDENPVEPDESDEEPVESTDDTDTEDTTEASDESTEAEDTTTEADVSTTEAEKTTTKASADETEKTTTKASADKTEKTTTKSSAKTEKTTTKSSAKTEKTTTKSSAKTEKTTTKSSAKTEKTTTKSSTKTNSTTTVTTTKTTTTKSTTVTTTTKWTPNFTTTTKTGDGVWTTTTKNNTGSGYEFEPGDEWELYWSDEFDGNTLNLDNWSYEVGKTGFYTENEENVTVQNGKLIITARHENPKNNKGLKFSTGAVNSAHKFSFQYGRLEFRARLPYGEGVFPALWTMGDYYLTTSDEKGWPRCGEIDVMEFIGGGSEAEKYTDPANKISTFNLHWGENRDKHEQLGTSQAKLTNGSIWADDYHIFAIEWDENSIKFFRDERMIVERSINDPSMLDAFHQKHWIIINVALCDFEPDIANDTTPLPQSMYVDYVRVYKKK